MSNLKPCPFCGSPFLRFSSDTQYIECEDCGTCGPISIDPAFNDMKPGMREKIASDLWNNRAVVINES